MFVERSSYEPHALGRMEWIKVYGTLLGCEDKAEKLFADKVDGIVDILQKPAAGKTVSFFTSRRTVRQMFANPRIISRK